MKFGFRRNRSWRIWLRNQNTGGRPPIPGNQGGHSIKGECQTLDPPPEPTAQGGRVRDPVRIQAIRRGLFDGYSVRDLAHGVLPCRPDCRGPGARTRRAARSRYGHSFCIFRAAPGYCRDPRSCADLRLRPLPITAICRQVGHSRGSHSLSSCWGLHSSPKRGITTITVGAKARPGACPAKAHYSKPPPSLLCIRIQTEKESKACLRTIGRLTTSDASPFFVLSTQAHTPRARKKLICACEPESR